MFIMLSVNSHTHTAGPRALPLSLGRALSPSFSLSVTRLLARRRTRKREATRCRAPLLVFLSFPRFMLRFITACGAKFAAWRGGVALYRYVSYVLLVYTHTAGPRVLPLCGFTLSTCQKVGARRAREFPISLSFSALFSPGFPAPHSAHVLAVQSNLEVRL